ncbi:putative ribosomal protein L16 [Rosa chinensis]|uniref:Putative ribosomal protein L16 n=1 Tax=Rosa chinensis TaxID=74649 RepID=A0A2P6QA34_ROSCH|nr:uncharacterized protein LOC112201758 [Rosa chinensis]PRQ31045.1 putative ribosomal protein L16 [Rosa chinensis]
MASRRLLSPLLRSPSRFSISNHNPTLSTLSQSPPRASPCAHLLRNALLTGRRMLHTSSSITTNSEVPALLGRIPSTVRYQATAATCLGGLRTTYKRSISSAQAIHVPSVQQTLATRTKVVDFLAPYQRGGNIGLFGGVGVGKNYAYYSAQPGGKSGGFKKQRKGRMKGLSCRGNRISFGKYGLQALEPAWITARQIEAGRRAMSRNARGGGKIWVRVISDKPVTAKPTEVRMGKGKGAVSHMVAVVLPGRILYEVSGVAENVARRAITIAGSKMPIKTKFVVSG